MGHYQRRQKRVAGPGFHVNIKMDQQTIAQLRGKNGFSNTNSLIPSSNHPEIYDIKEQELLVAKRAAGSMYHDGYTHCFSAVNGYSIDPNWTDRRQIADHILNDVMFVGIATTEQKANDSLIDQGCVATVAGVQTILNNGTLPIHPTDKVMLDINLSPQRASITRDKGIPRQKIQFSVRPADDDLTIIARAQKMCLKYDTNAEKETWRKARDDAKQEWTDADKALKAISEGDDTTAAEAAKETAAKKYKEASKQYKACVDSSSQIVDDPSKLQEFLRNYRHLNQLVIGKAMSFANPGDRFEILLQPRHCL